MTRPYKYNGPSISPSVTPIQSAPIPSAPPRSPDASPLSHLNIHDEIDPSSFCDENDRALSRRVKDLHDKQS